MGILDYLLIVLLLLVIAFGITAFIIYKMRQKYIRERFAFFATSTITSLIAACFIPLLQSETLISFTLRALNYNFGLNIQLGQSDAFSQTIMLVVLFLIVWLIRSFHKNWDGGQSVRQYEMEKYSRPESGLTDEAGILLRHLINRNKNLELNKPEKDDEHEGMLEKIQYDAPAWHIQVDQLLSLSSSQYNISREKDWYSEYSTYISSYGKADTSIAIYCVIHDPDEKDVKNFIKNAKEQALVIDRYIVAVKNKKNQRYEIEIDGQKVEMRFENEMLDSLFNFDEYREAIFRQYENNEVMLGSNTTLQDIYVEPTCNRKGEKPFESIEDYVADWSNDNAGRKHIAILGQYGQGKSVLSLKITYEMLKNPEKHQRIPILLILRGTSPRNLRELDLLSIFTNNYGIDPRALLMLHKAGRLLLIFEGFDEMDLAGDLELRLNHFRQLWKFAIPNAKILITGRPNLFLDTLEQERALGTSVKSKGEPYCEAVKLNFFSKNQIESALRNTPPENRNMILNLISASETGERFFNLISRPSVLFMVSQIWDSQKIEDNKRTINSATVIAEFIHHAFERQNLKYKGLGSSLLNNTEREYFMLGIAVAMIQINGYTNQIQKDELKSIVSQLYRTYPNELSKHYPTTTTHGDTLHDRMDARDWDEDAIFTDIRTNGLIVEDLTRYDHFKFSHKSFLEFLHALHEAALCGFSTESASIVSRSISNLWQTNVDMSRETMEYFTQLIRNEVQGRGEGRKIGVSCQKIFKVLIGRRQSIILQLIHKILPDTLWVWYLEWGWKSGRQSRQNQNVAREMAGRSEIRHVLQRTHGDAITAIAYLSSQNRFMYDMARIIAGCTLTMLLASMVGTYIFLALADHQAQVGELIGGAVGAVAAVVGAIALYRRMTRAVLIRAEREMVGLSGGALAREWRKRRVVRRLSDSAAQQLAGAQMSRPVMATRTVIGVMHDEMNSVDRKHEEKLPKWLNHLKLTIEFFRDHYSSR